jgi:hypothetical protein
LTEEEREERRKERKRYNKIFKIGMIVGTGVLAVIIFKFCKAKRMRNRNRMMQAMQAQQPQMMVQQQPYLYNLNQPAPVHPHAYPSAPAQPIQIGRPYQEQVSAPVVRGRVHDSFIRQPAENPMDAQIRFHEAEIQRLRQMRQARQEVELQRVPINTTESFESQQPMNRYRNMPVGQPVYPKDTNSSFASEYPEI